MTRPRVNTSGNLALSAALLSVVGLLIGAFVSYAQAPAADSSDTANLRLNFFNSPLEVVLDEYSAKTGRTLLHAPNVPKANVNLKSQGELTLDEYKEAIEIVLGMHGIALVPVGDEFLKVVPAKLARQDGSLLIKGGDIDESISDMQTMVSRLITLEHTEVGQVRAAIEPLKSANGQIHQFDQMNALLVTDLGPNVLRINELLKRLDVKVEAREEPHVIAIQHTKASEIRAMLLEIIADSQQNQKPSTVPRLPRSGTPTIKARTPKVPASIRARAARAAASEPEDIGELTAEAERGIIRGEVKIVADDRTNILIFITRPENMAFFEKIIKVLDVATAPDVIVKVFRLEYAEAKEIATMLNELIGATSKEEGPAGQIEGVAPEGESKTLREVATAKKPTDKPAVQGKSKVGELSKDNIKILSDERTNSLIIMASKSDVATLWEIINDMDLMLSQVLIEAVILEVNLDDSVESGVDWLQRALVAYEKGADGSRTPIAAFSGSGGGGSAPPVDSRSFTTPSEFPVTDRGAPLAGLSYYLTLFNLNLDVVFNLVSSDNRTHIVSSPLILTLDNKDATIEVSTERYFYKGKKYAGSASGDPVYEDDVERKNVGITLSVTPRINEKGFVVMEITQTIDNVSGVQTINNEEWPIVTTRKLEADIAIRSADTIVLGGLVQETEVENRSKIPLLGDIPILGWPFRNDRKEKVKNEVIVLITPYVMDSPEAIMDDATRRLEATSTGRGMFKRGWSASHLAAPTDQEVRQTERELKAIERREKQAAQLEKARARARRWEELQSKREAAEAEEAAKEAQRALPDLDPKTAALIQEQDKAWERRLEAEDRRIEAEIREAEIK